MDAFNDFPYRGLMITHYPTAYLFGIDETEGTTSDVSATGNSHASEYGNRIQTFAYADYSGENAPHDHHHAPLDHWSMDNLRHFIEEVAGIPAEMQVQNATPGESTAANEAADEDVEQTTLDRGAGWSAAKEQLQVLLNKLADPALGGASRLALEQHVRALNQAEKGGWTEAELSKLRRNGYL